MINYKDKGDAYRDKTAPGALAMTDSGSPTVIVLFGVTGDLAGRKVLPALYHLLKDGLLPDKCRIIGTTRQDISKEDLLSSIELCILESDKVCDPLVLSKFNKIFEVMRFDPVKIDSYQLLKNRLSSIERDEGVCFNRLFYLSIPPQVYNPIVRMLGEGGLSKGCEHQQGLSRLLVEKPFGYDLYSAKELIKDTNKYFSEDQIFRIDHYLAKETAQNILAFRKYNPLFNDIWDKSLIRGVHIRALESMGIEGRVNFYDNVGALRDIVQSHLLQLLTLITMELPKDLNSGEQIHAQKIKVLGNVSPVNVSSKSLIRGQYASYKSEVSNDRSTAETYVKLTLFVKNKRWANVPLTLETGKALKQKTTDITIDVAGKGDKESNQLTIRIQPDEGIGLKLFVKKPGFDNQIDETMMDFSYKQAFGVDLTHPDAYERVLVDAIRGDQSLFATSREVIRSWEILQPVLDHWSHRPEEMLIYNNGSTGPALSGDLLN